MESTQTQRYNGHAIATAFHGTGTKDVVIFCHGYRSSTIGPNRFFVRAARELARQGISSLRFDQYGSGNSEGDFIDSSFTDWVETTKAIAQGYLAKGYRVGLFGQSMGGSTVIMAGAALPELAAIVSWVPDGSIEDFHAPESGMMEESGQLIKATYWQEAHDAKISEQSPLVKAPMYIIQCTADEYVDKINRDALQGQAQANHKIDNFENYPHSSWTYEQSEEIISRSVAFLVKSFRE